MKICYLANSASVHTQRWAKYFQVRGHNISVISFTLSVIEGIRVYNLASVRAYPHLNILWNLTKVRQIVRDIHPDVLHAHYVTSYGLSGALTGKHPFVITAWGSDVLVNPEKSSIYRQMVSFALRRADLVTSVADHMTQHLERRYVLSNKIVTFPFGVDIEMFNLGQRRKNHMEKSAVVLSTRSLNPGSDVQIYIRAISKVIKFYPDVRFIVIGNGLVRPKLEQLAADLGIKERVQFLGAIPHKEMPALLGQADVFVSTSPSDGSSVSLNEAMAVGAFPIATDIPANRTWIESGKNGLLFQCGDDKQLAETIVQVLSQPKWRQAVMAENWEIVTRRANWQVGMVRMENLYESLL